MYVCKLFTKLAKFYQLPFPPSPSSATPFFPFIYTLLHFCNYTFASFNYIIRSNRVNAL